MFYFQQEILESFGRVSTALLSAQHVKSSKIQIFVSTGKLARRALEAELMSAVSLTLHQCRQELPLL